MDADYSRVMMGLFEESAAISTIPFLVFVCIYALFQLNVFRSRPALLCQCSVIAGFLFLVIPTFIPTYTTLMSEFRAIITANAHLACAIGMVLVALRSEHPHKTSAFILTGICAVCMALQLDAIASF